MPADTPTVYQTTQACQEPNLEGTEPEHEPGTDLFSDPDQHDPDRFFDRIQEEE